MSLNEVDPKVETVSEPRPGDEPNESMPLIGDKPRQQSTSEQIESVLGDDLKKPPSAAQSLTTVFSTWNTMIGSSLLSLTWAFGESGLIGGIVVVLVMGLVTWYTMSLILRRGFGQGDFVDVCRRILGQPGRWAAWLGSVLILLGAVFIYDILLATNVYSLVEGILLHIYPQHSSASSVSGAVGLLAEEASVTRYWTPKTAPIIFGVVFLPLLNVPSLQFYVKMSGMGIAGMLYVVTFIVVSALAHWQPPSVKRDLFFKPHAFFLAGIMALAFFVHNFVLQVTRPYKAVGRSLRDVTIGFSLGGLSYAAIGAITYAALGAGVPQDYFDYYPKKDIFAMTGKVALLFELGCVLPFIFALLRTQIFSAFLGPKVAERPHWALTLAYSSVLLTIATLMAIFYPHIGDVIRFTGAICGVLYVFALPVTVHVVMLKREGRLNVLNASLHVVVLLVGITVLVSQFI